MTQTSVKFSRCAIYTRKSTEHGLELEFNSLDAQREASEAYIKSQASLGWRLIATRYDDPAYSGGSLDRPALQTLLSDIQAKRIDVIVVYKIDRLTRSLADFAKLVEVFEKNSVSFVAVTQQFNTTTSMGRLTLNVLLSFAQFERELSSERVRDKFAASRKKGKWMGGNAPFGYHVREKRLVIDSSEAKTVRDIFSNYLKLKSIEKLLDYLDNQKVNTRRRSIGGRSTGEIPFGFGALAYLLKNQIYIGNVNYKGEWFPGEQQSIVDRKIFDSVQKLLKSNSIIRRRKNAKNRALLTGLIFDDNGNRMSPSYTIKNGVRYRFYVSSALLRGKASNAGSVRRISAAIIEREVLSTLREFFSKKVELDDDRNYIEMLVSRIIVGSPETKLELNSYAADIIRKSVLEISTPIPEKPNERIEGRFENGDDRLLNAFVKAHILLRMLLEGKSIQDVARMTKMHPRAIQSNLRLAFIAPCVAKSILRMQPNSISNLTKFQNSLSLSWEEHEALGFDRQIKDKNLN